MRFFGLLVLMAMLALSGCAGIQGYSGQPAKDENIKYPIAGKPRWWTDRSVRPWYYPPYHIHPKD